MNKIFYCIIIILLVNLSDGYGQEMLNPKKDFIYGTKYFDPYSPYLNLGYGLGFNTVTNDIEKNISAEFHFNFKKIPINLGYFMSSNRFVQKGTLIRRFNSNQRLHNFHLGAGYRWERLRKNFGIYGGISYNSGRVPVDNSDSLFIQRKKFGIYIQTHYEIKPVYDMGYGIGLFAFYSKYYKIYGVNIHVFFSASYKALKKY